MGSSICAILRVKLSTCLEYPYSLSYQQYKVTFLPSAMVA